mmetsp:Transcript_52232/g.131130  ORF Transcript_52232/g.131130 Transcript_52232/m.131130 type:complete len:113 (+) Transcript_52232:2128-2466(+)
MRQAVTNAVNGTPLPAHTNLKKRRTKLHLLHSSPHGWQQCTGSGASGCMPQIGNMAAVWGSGPLLSHPFVSTPTPEKKKWHFHSSHTNTVFEGGGAPAGICGAHNGLRIPPA